MPVQDVEEDFMEGLLSGVGMDAMVTSVGERERA